MKQRDIVEASAVGALLIIVLCAALTAFALAVSGCQSGPVLPVVVPPSPQPVPAGTACERAEYHGNVDLDCHLPARFIQTCEAYGSLGQSASYDPECMQRARSCSAFDDCRGGQ